VYSKMNFTKKILLPTLFALGLLVAACGGSGSTTTSATTKAAANKQVFVSTLAGAGVPDFNTLDPALVTDANSGTAINTVFTGLVSLDQNLAIQPQLAASWTQSANKLSWTFTLKPNTKFSDGTPLTSTDVAYSINRALAPATKSPTAPYYLRYIKDSATFNNGKIKTLIGDSLLTPNANTITIVTSQVVPFFLETLTYPTSYVVEKSVIDKYGTGWTDHLDTGGGAGPFKVLHYIHNKELDLVPNTNYYDAQPQLKELIFPFYKVADTTIKDYLVNRVDDATIPLADYTTDKTRSDFHQHPVLVTYYYTMNYNQKPFDNIQIRQAFELAINKSLIASNIWKGSFIATNHIVPEGMTGYNTNLTGPDGVKGTSGDPALAKQLLQQGLKAEGYSSVAKLPPITLTYSSAGVQATSDEVAAIQQMWQNVLSISVKTDDIDINTLFADESKGANNPLQFYSGPGWIADYNHPSDFTTLQFDAGASQNSMNYGQNKGTGAAEQQAVQKELEKADATTDPTASIAAYNDAEQKLVNDVAWLPMEQGTASGLLKPCVQNFQTNAEGLVAPDAWSKVYISTNPSCASTTVGS
jgi:oligopeptide transport system substrate-binding protein